MTNSTEFITQALQAVISRPEHDLRVIETFFGPNYRQTVDGIELDYMHFVAHMAKLKQITDTMELTILTIAQQGDTVLSHHVVNVVKTNGLQLLTEVFASFTLEKGRIVACQELTRAIGGSEEDKRLGSIY